MKLADKSAYPAGYQDTSGLTLREHLAGLALQGVLANPKTAEVIAEAVRLANTDVKTGYAMMALEYADALIAQLEKEEAKP